LIRGELADGPHFHRVGTDGRKSPVDCAKRRGLLRTVALGNRCSPEAVPVRTAAL
jgi:hypothetical protein